MSQRVSYKKWNYPGESATRNRYPKTQKTTRNRGEETWRYEEKTRIVFISYRQILIIFANLRQCIYRQKILIK